MKITVAVPSYNKEKYIRRCLESIVHEKEHLEKILLIDNCSSDDTYKIAEALIPSVTCVKNSSNLGMSGNWNRCIDLCDTDWLMIFHADDEMVPGSIKHYIDLIKKYPSIGLIYANSYSIVEDKESTRVKHTITQKEFWKAGLDAMSCKGGACSAIMVKKEVYNKLGYFIDKSLSSDVEMWHRIASKYDVAFLSEATVTFRANSTSTGVSSLVTRNIKDIKADWDNLEKLMASHYPDDSSRAAFIADQFKNAPGSYFTVAKANIRAKNIKSVLQALYLIIFTYRGFMPLLRMAAEIVKKRMVLLWS